MINISESIILISHRGNIHGPSIKENNPNWILNHVIDYLGLNVEIDVWYIDNELWLGHDKPQYKCPLKLVQHKLAWCHAKNLEALEFLLLVGAHCFWHENDKRTLTSQGYIWTYPDQKPSKRGILVIERILKDTDFNNTLGICTDYTGVLA